MIAHPAVPWRPNSERSSAIATARDLPEDRRLDVASLASALTGSSRVATLRDRRTTPRRRCARSPSDLGPRSSGRSRSERSRGRSASAWHPSRSRLSASSAAGDEADAHERLGAEARRRRGSRAWPAPMPCSGCQGKISRPPGFRARSHPGRARSRPHSRRRCRPAAASPPKADAGMDAYTRDVGFRWLAAACAPDPSSYLVGLDAPARLDESGAAWPCNSPVPAPTWITVLAGLRARPPRARPRAAPARRC